MQRSSAVFVLLLLMIGLTACSPVKLPNVNPYQLSAFSKKYWPHARVKHTILVTLPESVAGYQTANMLYVKKPFSLQSFATHTWVDSPASMLHPLLIESLQQSSYFQAIASVAYAEPIEYRLDTQLLKLQQNFVKKPSVIEFSAKVVLSQVDKNQILVSRIFNLEMPCPQDSPYGGVIAANKVAEAFTAEVTEFVIKHAN
jgi:cholesterol transport system auxiliary component